MKKKMARVFTILLVVMFSVMLMSATAFAANEPEISVPVKITLTGAVPSVAEEYTVKLEADDMAFPMPDGAEDGVFTLTFKGADEQNVEIAYDQLGIYTYTIHQEPGSNERATYDESVYSLTVYVTNEENGDGFEATTVLRKEGENAKPDCVEFINDYEPEPVPDTPKTGEGRNDLWLYLVLMFLSAGVIVVLLSVKKCKAR